MSWVHIVCHECTQESWAVFRRTDPWVLVMFTKCALYLYKISRSIAFNNFAYLCMYDVIVTDWDRGVQARWTPEPEKIVRRDRVAVEVLKARARVFI
jgi:hypothetical protein